MPKSIEDLELQASIEDELAEKLTGAAAPRKPPLKSYLLGFAILILMVLLNQWLFRILFHTTYWDWYVKNGTIIGFATSLLATTWGDINKNTDLISSHPLRYLAACSWLVALPFYSLGTHLRRSDDPARLRAPLDIFLTFPFVLIIMALLLIWVIVVTPLQYFIYLVCGAPARLYLQSEWRPVARVSKNRSMAVEEIPATERIPKGWWDASLFAKPVSATALMSSIFLFVLRLILA
ncbi:MAG: hypothetical protein Q7J73_03360 [Dehalococcoidales bacterium]|nr:hypothetical protein [Dehalococcoidales bacterium]